LSQILFINGLHSDKMLLQGSGKMISNKALHMDCYTAARFRNQ
jgi:hypothetical protein